MNVRQTQQGQSAGNSILQRASSGLLQRKCDSCGQHTIAGGTCGSCEKRKGVLQRKLMIGASNDPLELEADRVADQVMAGPEHLGVGRVPPPIDRSMGELSVSVGAAPPSVDRVLSSQGRPLDSSLREDMGKSFGRDFSEVRIHTGAEAEESVDDVNASAYTAGNHIVFGKEQFTPQTGHGRRLIAHELTHVIQQMHIGQEISQRPNAASVHSGEQGERQVSSGPPPIRVEGSSAMRVLRTPAPPRNFEGAQMITVELPLSMQTPERMGYEKDFHGYLPKNIVEDDNLWHASHAVGPGGTGVEKEEGILLAPRGVNLSLQKNLENHIRDIRASAIPGTRLVLHIETAAHAGTRRLAYINYELRVSAPDGASNRLSVSVTVTNDTDRPQAHVSVHSTMGGEATRRYSDAINIRKDSGPSRPGPLRPKEPGSSTYSSTSSSTTRHKIPDPEVYQKRIPPPNPQQLKPPTAKAGDITQAATAGTAPQPGALSPIIPGRTTTSAVSPPQPARTGPGSKQPQVTTTSPQTTATTGTPTSVPTTPAINGKPAAIGAALSLANDLVKEQLQAISTAKAHSAAWNDYYESIPGIMEQLWQRPGEGAALEFKFIHIRHPQDILPGTTEYAGMQMAIGANPNIKVTFNPQMQSGRDFNPENIRTETIRRWIPPVRPAAPTAVAAHPDSAKLTTPETAPSQAAAAHPAPMQRAQILIATVADFVKYVKVRPDMFVGASIDAYEFLNSGVAAFGGYEITRPEVIYIVPHAFREVLLKGFRDDLAKHLTRRTNELEADIRYYENRMSNFLQESWPTTIRRGDIDLRKHEHMFDSPKAHLAAVRGMIGVGAFRNALASLERGEADVGQNKKILFHYEKGIPSNELD